MTRENARNSLARPGGVGFPRAPAPRRAGTVVGPWSLVRAARAHARQLVAAFVLVAGCDSHADVSTRRAAAVQKGNTIHVGVVYDRVRAADFSEGVRLALAIEGEYTPDGRRIEVTEENDFGTVEFAIEAAQRFVDDPRFIAVLGHDSFPAAITTSLQYEFGGLGLITPAAGPARLLRPGFVSILRLRPSAEAYGRRGAAWVGSQSRRRTLVVAQSDDEASRAAVAAFEQSGEAQEVQIAHRISFGRETRAALEGALRAAGDLRHDIVVLACSDRLTDQCVRTVRASGWSGPVLSLLSRPQGASTETWPELFVIELNSADSVLARRLREAWHNRHRTTPTLPALLGFDAMHALLASFRGARRRMTTRPVQDLRGMVPLPSDGVTGRMEFGANGERRETALVVSRWADGAWR